MLVGLEGSFGVPEAKSCAQTPSGLEGVEAMGSAADIIEGRKRSSAPAVTIGLPFFNARSTLERAVQSVFAQTCTDWELILIDDGSTDGSVSLARAVQDPRVRVVSDGKNVQLAARLNQVATMARAPLVARMDADDLMHPERLARQIEFMSNNPRIEVLGSAAITIDAAGEPQGKRGATQLSSRAADVFERGLFLHPTVMMRTDWARANRYSTIFPRAEDLELWVRVYDRTQMALLSEPLLFYREGVPVKGYAESQHTNRKILRRFGAARIGLWTTAWLWAQSLAKEWTYRLAGPLGVERMLLRRRNSALTLAEVAWARRAISAITAIRVPGLHP